MTIVEKAKIFAIAAHSAVGQKRKHSGAPYWVHPADVVDTLRFHKATDVELAAGWLHDVVEDTKINLKTIEMLFGKEIAETVDAVTKTSDLKETHLKVLKVDSAIKLKIADTCSNLKDAIVEASCQSQNSKFARKFLEKKKLMIADWKESGFDVRAIPAEDRLFFIIKEMLERMESLETLLEFLESPEAE